MVKLLQAALLGLLLGARSGGRSVPASVTPRAAVPAEQQGSLGLIRIPGQLFVLTRLERPSLAPLGPRVPIGEYHYAWSFSPDCSELALAISAPGGGTGRIGIRIVDLRRMAVRQDVATGVAAEALGWVLPNRLIAGLQTGEVVVVDTPTGRILRRERLPMPLGARASPHLARQTPSGLAILLNSRAREAPPHMVFVDAGGAVRSVQLDQMLRHSTPESWMSSRTVGMAVDATQERAFVAGSGSSIAEIDLKTMGVRYRGLPGPLALGTRCPTAERDCSSVRSARWLGEGRIGISGADSSVSGDHVTTRPQATVRPAGAVVFDTHSWSGWLVRGASNVVAAGDRVLVYGGGGDPVRDEGIGLRAYRFDGRRLFHLFGSERVWSVELAGGHAYASSDEETRVVEVSSGKVVGRIAPDRPPFYLVPECTTDPLTGSVR